MAATGQLPANRETSNLYTDTPYVLPHSRAEFYRQSTDVLLRQWHQERNQYEARDKQAVLQHLALYNQGTAEQRQQDRRSIDFQTVLDQVRQVLPKLNLRPEQDTRPLLDEIVYRSGLLLSIDGGERYQFAHLTLQEFFAAAELIDDVDGLFARFSADHDAWRETVKLWCELARDSTALIRAVYVEHPITAFECLADAKKLDRALTEEIIDAFKARLGAVGEDDAIVRAFGAVASDLRPRGKAVFEFLEEILVRVDGPARRMAAANALSLTNLPQAAEVLVDHYVHVGLNEVRAPLVRMGDLAVPALTSLAKAGFVEAMNDLQAIGTPKAAQPLVPLLWHPDQNLAANAAWRLAALLPQPNVEDMLRDYELTEEQRKADWLDWVWQPFNEPVNSALPIISGRVAYLMDQAPIETAPTTPPPLDPRLVIPLCSMKAESKKLSRVRPFSWTRTVSRGRFRDTETESVHTEVTSTVQIPKRVFDEIDASPRWRYLLHSLTLSLQFDLVRRLMDGPIPTRSDWLDIFRPVTYEFRTGWHYRVILALAAIVSILALGQMAAIVLHSPILLSWRNGLVSAAALAVVLSWYVFWRGLARLHIPHDPEYLFFYGLLGPILALPPLLYGVYGTILSLLANDLDEAKEYVKVILVFVSFFGWLPALGYFVTVSLLSVLPWQYVVLVWVTLLVTCAALWLLGKRRHRAAQNPLRGILEAQVSGASLAHGASRGWFPLLRAFPR